MWIRVNPNPKHREVPDCVIRAISIALNLRWYDVFDDLCALGRHECNMPSADAVWGKYLKENGWQQMLVPDTCPACYTVKQFCNDNPRGYFILVGNSHVICAIDGAYFDTWDSGDETVVYFFKRKEGKTK